MSIEDYNYVIHKVCAKLWFCEKEPLEEDKIEKTLQTMLLLIGSYHINIRPGTTNTMLTSFVIYSRLRSMMSLILRIIMLGLLLFLRSIIMRRIHISLFFSRKIIRKKNSRFVRRRRNKRKNRQLAKTMKKDVASFKGSNILCRACGGFKHITEKCRTPKHLVALY
jgi:hypothetical protein